MQATIVIARQEHASFIAAAQLKMAMETESLQLDAELVAKAVNYFIATSKEGQFSTQGVYLVRLVANKPVGSLLLTFETPRKWWIQSVFVEVTERRQGHFTALFGEAVKLASQHHAVSLKLYAEQSNARAKSTYFRLGMHVIPDKFYSYDFVLGGCSLPTKRADLTVSKAEATLEGWTEGKVNVLTGEKYQLSEWEDAWEVRCGEERRAVVKCFSEFSDWRFGVMRYIREVYLQGVELQEVVDAVAAHLVGVEQLKVGAVRVVYRGDEPRLKGGHVEHYEVLELPLKPKSD